MATLRRKTKGRLLPGLPAALAVLLTGCASTDGVLERLDSGTGLTVLTEARVLTFARTATEFSRSARDYVYLGPVEVNERGTRQHFIWVGLASTIDRGFVAAEINAPGILYLEIDGAPIELELAPWEQRVPELVTFDFYDPAVQPYSVLAARVTLNLLRVLSEQEIASVRVSVDGVRSAEYALWERQPPWPNFVSYSGF